MLIQVTTRPCPDCKKTEVLKIPDKDYANFLANKMSIQDALPTLTNSQRERLLTGVCGPCWDILCSDDGEEDD